MSGRLILGIANPSLDANGAIVSGATLTFYANLTTTPQTVYADSGLSTPLSNPLTADASGIFPQVWVADNLGYSVKWSRTGLSNITYDNIFGTPSSYVTLAGVQSLSNKTFVAPVLGAATATSLTTDSLIAEGNFGSTKRNIKRTQAAGVQFSMFSWPCIIDNLQQTALVKISASVDDANTGYAGYSSLVAITFGSFGGSYQAPSGATIGSASFSVNAGVIAISISAAITISAGTATLKLTPNTTGSTGFTTATVTTQIELLGSQDNVAISAL